jgi:predicted PurR-regulated permease PerM
VAVALAALLLVCYLLRYVLLPFVIAGGLTYMVAPLLQVLQRRLGIPRWAAGVLVFCGFLVLLGGIAVWARLMVLPEVGETLTHAPQHLHHFVVQVLHGERAQILGRTISAEQVSQQIVTRLGAMVRNPAQAITVLTTSFEVIMGLVLTIVLLFYFLLQGEQLRHRLLWLVPPQLRAQVVALAAAVDPVLGRYIRGLFVIVAYAVLLTWLVLGLLVGISHALLLALLVGVLELIPVLGPMLAIVLVGVSMVRQVSVGTLVTFALFVIGMRISIDQLLGPLVLGRAARLHPVVIIFAFLAGGTLFGILGVLLAIPVAATIKIALQQHYEPSPQSEVRPAQR